MKQSKTADRYNLLVKALQGRQEVYNLTGKYSAGLKDSKRALSFCRKRIRSHQLESRLMVDLADSLRWNNKHKEAKKMTMAAMKRIDRNKEKISYARCLNLLGMLNDDMGNLEDTLAYYQKAIRINEAVKHKSGVASGANNIGLYFWTQGELSKALSYFKRALRSWEAANNRVGMGVAFGNLGVAFFSMGDLNRALEYFTNNLQVSQEINHKIRIVIALGNVGEVHREKGNYQQAKDFYQKALDLAKELGNSYEIAFAHLYLGDIHAAIGNYAEAKKLLKKAKKSFLTMNHRINLASVFIALARIHREEKDHERSLKCAHKALSLSREIGAKEQEIGALREMAKTLVTTNRKVAISHLEKAVSIAEEEMMQLELAKSSYELAIILKSKGKSTEAKQYIKQAKTIFENAGTQAWLKKIDATL